MDRGDLSPQFKHLDKGIFNPAEIVQFFNTVAHNVSHICSSGSLPLILGGDHSISIGTLAGICKHYRNLGVIWLDAHPDLNNHETTLTGNIFGMSLASNLGLVTNWITDIGGFKPKVRAENIVLVGTREFDEAEVRIISNLNIKYFSTEDIQRCGVQGVIRNSISYLKQKCDGIHLSFDLDVLDSKETPGVRTPVADGITITDCEQAMRLMGKSNLITSAEVVELNPNLDKNNKTALLAKELILALF